MRGNRPAIKLAARRSLFGLLGLAALSSQNALHAAGSDVLPVPAITIYPGDVIKDEFLVDRDFSAGPAVGATAVVESRAAIAGKVARRTLLPGSPIPWNAVADPKVVGNGTKVRIVFEDGALTIMAYGTALQAGRAGDVISVRNLTSGLTVSGTVQADGSVRAGAG